MALARLATSWSKWTPLALAAALLLLLVAPDRAQAAGEQTYFVLCASAGAAKPFALGQTSSARDRVCSALSSPSDSYAPSLWTDLQAAQPALSLVQSTAFSWNQGTPPTLGAGGNLISKASLSSIAVTLDASAPLAPEILTQVMAARVVPTAFIFNTASGGSGPAPTSLWRLGNVAVWNVTTTINAGARPSYKLDLVPQSASYRVWTFDNAGTPIKYNLATCFAAPSYTVNNADTC